MLSIIFHQFLPENLTVFKFIEVGIFIMQELEIMSGILNSYPYPIVFVDKDYIIRYMNKNARYYYCDERGYGELIGKSIFDCHRPESAELIKEYYKEIQRHGKEIFVNVSIRNQRVYMQGVRNDKGEWIGFFERFELNVEK